MFLSKKLLYKKIEIYDLCNENNNFKGIFC